MAKDEQAGRLSREATTVDFSPPIPILRVPLAAGQEDDPYKGPFVLAFQDECSWLNAWHECEVKLAARCEAGARMGCSINAVKKCKPPWWLHILPLFSNQNHPEEDKEACEEREMQCCLTSSQSRCASYAKETCEEGFSDVRIMDSSTLLDSQKYRLLKGFSKEEATRLVLDRGNQIKQKTFDEQS